MKKLRFPKLVQPFERREKIILRDYLALERTTLANERTLFAYIRTSLYLLIGGIGLLEFDEFENLIWLGYTALFISALLIIYGLVRYYALRKKLRKLYREENIPE